MAADSIVRFQPEVPLTAAPALVSRASWLSDEARRLPLHLMADSGTGKSRAGGRGLCYFEFLRGTPQVILDCAGGTISNFLDRILCLPPAWQEKLWPRIRYTELGARDYVTPLPFFYRLQPDEPLAVTAGRYLEVIRRADPYLATASIEGWNSLYETGMAAGILAASVDGQITDMLDLVQHPKAWLKRHAGKLPDAFGVQPALAHVQFFSRLSPDRQRRLAGSLLTKLIPYQVHPELTAFVAGKRPGVTMEELERKHLTWLIDGRTLPAAQKQEMLLWVFRFVTDYVRHRGQAGREHPLHFFIDEITQVLGFSSLQNEALAEDLEQLLSVDARNFGCRLTISHQSLMQINSERIRAALMAMANQIIGRISSPQDRLYLADYFLHFDPYRVKKRIPTYFNMAEPAVFRPDGRAQIVMLPNPRPIDYTTEEYTIDEQTQLLAHRFRNLDRFCFLMRPATAEGSVADGLHEVTIEPMDRGRYPDEKTIAEVRRQLRARDGYPVTQLLAELGQHKPETIAVKPAPQNAILEGDEVHVQKSRPVPTRKRKKARKPAKDAPAPAGDDAWQQNLWQDPK